MRIHFVSRRRGITSIAAVLFLAAAVSASGYRLFGRTDDDSLIPGAAEALRWSPEVWGPADSLVWTVSKTPAWTAPYLDRNGEEQEAAFSSIEHILPFVEQGLDAWSSVESARIEWTFEMGEEELHRERDGKNAIRIHRYDGQFSYAGLFIVGGEMVECDVSLGPRSANNLAGWGLSILIHEFGHCVGLAHAAVFPTWDSSFWRNGFGDAVWWEDPKMSYGFDRGYDLHEDDALGASLLRPAPGWAASTGSIAGRLVVDDQPARFTRIVATRLEGNEAGWSANAFADEEGRYVLEGVPPGRYLLSAGTMVQTGAHGSLFDAGAVVGVRDRYLLLPITVVAGEETRAPPVALVPGREFALWSWQAEEEGQ